MWKMLHMGSPNLRLIPIRNVFLILLFLKPNAKKLLITPLMGLNQWEVQAAYRANN